MDLFQGTRIDPFKDPKLQNPKAEDGRKCGVQAV